VLSADGMFGQKATIYAEKVIDVNIIEDPTCHVAVDKI
jgi:hypothetical protein